MKFNIKPKRKSKEIEIENGKFIVIDYPNIEQQEKLNEILAQIFSIDEELKNTNDKLQRIELSSKKLTLVERFMKQFIRFTLKEVKGYDFNLVLENNQLNDETYEAVCYDPIQVSQLFDLISKELEFAELDKKKLNGS